VKKWVSQLCAATAVAGVALFTTGCASSPMNICPTAPANAERLGPAKGVATGHHGIWGPPLYVVPIGLNSRVEKAYSNAVASVPGATGLIDVTLQESWYWWIFATARKVTITGEAIK